MDILFYILAGICVGFTVGLTGVGGGSLMTPLLLMFGFPPNIAVGTDLLYASITKSGGVWVHHKQRTIQWRIVSLLALGSLPGSILTIIILHFFYQDADQYAAILTTTLGIMLMGTASVLLFRKYLHKIIWKKSTKSMSHQQSTGITIVFGFILGALVTLSSVGAGALGTALLLTLYPRLIAVKVVGTDLAHAVPLTLVAGLGHLLLGNVDYFLLVSLLVGSIPAVYFGTKIGSKLPDYILQPVLASALLILGIKYVFF